MEEKSKFRKMVNKFMGFVFSKLFAFSVVGLGILIIIIEQVFGQGKLWEFLAYYILNGAILITILIATVVGIVYAFIINPIRTIIKKNKEKHQ